METKKSFQLSVETKGKLTLANKNLIIEQALDIISEMPTTIIQDDSELKRVKEFRASCNNCIKAIDRLRIDYVADYTSEFEADCNAVKKIFEDKQKELGVAVKTYEDSKKEVVVERKHKITATLKFYDENIIKKIKKFAEQNGCELSIK